MIQPSSPETATPARLVLEDGRAFRGLRFGALRDGAGEVVFNTAMTGYQEILTDPSYAGQIVVMTYPMIGNYGVAVEDAQSRRLHATGLVVKEPSPTASNWRHHQTLPAYLEAHGVPGLWNVDTRALVRHLRQRGSLRGVIADADQEEAGLVGRARALPPMAGRDLASEVTEGRTYGWSEGPLQLRDGTTLFTPGSGGPHHVVVWDLGIKYGILRRLVAHGARVTVVPAGVTATQVLELAPDGVVLGNGPGDPEPLDAVVRQVRELLGRVPILGICLGHQLLARALGGRTFKLPFGHHGSNHPVLDLTTGRVEITSHNHGFAVDPDSLPESEVELTHVNLNDRTLEGFRSRTVPALAVQFHPEAAPGPNDATHVFERFAALLGE